MPALDAESRQTAPVFPAPARPARPVVVDFYEEEEKLDQTLAALQQRVNQFRTQKETLKAQYTAANALTSVNESVARISNTLGDSSAALERAQEKIANMQARAGALDKLFHSPTLRSGAAHLVERA